jgi:hypothetical protein
MKLASIKMHLRPYSIHDRRRTTINHAFASALAPRDDYDSGRIAAALRVLGQEDPDNLTCVFCDAPAETWDHLVGLVEKQVLRGYGHQLGNLVPCCRQCNSLKGSKPWEHFLEKQIVDAERREVLGSRIREYLRTYAAEVDLSHAADMLPEQWSRYESIKSEIFKLMRQADDIAVELQKVVAQPRA